MVRTLALIDKEVFPPQSGETIPIAAHLQALAELGPIDLACIGFKPRRASSLPSNIRWFHVAAEPARSAASKAWSNLRGQLPGRVPANLLELCSRLTNRDYDLTYVGQLRLLDWAKAAKSCLQSVPMMINMCDSPVEVRRRMRALAKTSGFQPGFRVLSLLRSFQVRSAHRWEAEAAALFETVLVQSENDRMTVAGSAGEHGDRVIIAPNGVQDTAFDYCYRGRAKQRLLHLGGLAGERFQLVLWFIRKVFRPLRTTHPDATLHLVGSVSDSQKAFLHRYNNVVCHGFVDDLRGCMEEATLSVAPMMMRFGVINKAAESMAAGLPATGLGAFTGFPGFVNGKHGMDVTSASEWIQTLRFLLNTPQQLDELSEQGREFAKKMRWAPTLQTIKDSALASVRRSGYRPSRAA